MLFRLSKLIICSAMGRFNIGTIGLGKSQVNGRSRVPDPPAISTARINPPQWFILVTFFDNFS